MNTYPKQILNDRNALKSIVCHAYSNMLLVLASGYRISILLGVMNQV